MKSPRLSTAGFTLLEVTLAVTILTVVITAVYATWNTALTAWKRGTAITESFQRERIVMETLTDLAQSAVFFGTRPDLYRVYSEHTPGQGDSISFVTASDTLLPASEALAAGLRRVTLRLVRGQDGGTFLAIANQPAVHADEGNEAPAWYVLSADVSGFGVRYRHPRDGTWLELWEEPGLLPSALMFTVAFRGDDRRVPPLVVTRAVELPAAQFLMESMGQSVARGGTNTVTRQDINLAEQGGGAEQQGGNRP